MTPLRICRKSHGNLTWGACRPLGRRNLDRLTRAAAAPWTGALPGPLDGRARVKVLVLDHIGPVVMKSYHRGGAMARLSRDRYLRLGRSRSQREFAFLIHAAAAGARVPRPVAFACQGTLLYRAWLVTEMIPGHQRFAVMARQDPQWAAGMIPRIRHHVRCLVEKKIFHPDLHPGNILLDDAARPWLIDFDKACFARISRRRLMARYAARWQAAVRKHHLPGTIRSLDFKGS